MGRATARIRIRVISLFLSVKSLRSERQASNTKNRFSHWISSLAESSIHLAGQRRFQHGQEGGRDRLQSSHDRSVNLYTRHTRMACTISLPVSRARRLLPSRESLSRSRDGGGLRCARKKTSTRANFVEFRIRRH